MRLLGITDLLLERAIAHECVIGLKQGALFCITCGSDRHAKELKDSRSDLPDIYFFKNTAQFILRQIVIGGPRDSLGRQGGLASSRAQHMPDLFVKQVTHDSENLLNNAHVDLLRQ